MKFLKRVSIPLFVIFLIALLLRIAQLGSIPVGLHGDEASIGYNAYSLIKTARDQDGNFLPLSFNQFGNFRAAGYQYLDIPFIILFGLNAFAVRLPAAIFGAFTVIVFYFLLLELFEHKQMALLGSFLLAILPWHINISRAGFEGVISSFFVLLGIYFLFRGIKQKTFSKALYGYGFLFLFISIFFYHASVFFIPLFLPFLFILSFLRFRPIKEKIIGSAVVYAALVLGVILFLTVGHGTGRASQVSLLNIPGGTKDVKQFSDEDGTQNPLITRSFHNKLYFYSRLFMTFYSEHFSGDFLFVHNGNPVRYRLLDIGNLYLIEAPFLLLGFAILLTEGIKQKKYLYLLPVVWLLLGALAAALTWDDIPNVIRTNLMIPALMMVVVFGFYETLALIKGTVRKVFIVVCALILFQSMSLFLHNYFYHSKIHEPWYRSAAEEDLVYTVQSYVKEGKPVIMTTERNNSLIYYLFYLKFDPKKFQSLGSPKEEDKLEFEGMIFKYNPCPVNQIDSKKEYEKYKDTIFVVHSDLCKLPQNAEILKTIRTPDGMPAFYIVHLFPPS